MKKRHELILISTDKASKLGLQANGVLKICGEVGIGTYQHLYLIDKETEIKVEDWYIDDVNQVRQSITDDKNYENIHNTNHTRKLIG